MEHHPTQPSNDTGGTQNIPETKHEGSGSKEPANLIMLTLQECFHNLNQNNKEQTDRLHAALEALGPKAPVVDQTTAFWNAYKTVADEFDKEFFQKYSTDLDTALIFAGLFSAVSSAFIIQIQPELQPDPMDTNQALMRLLIHNINGSIFSDADISIPEWNGPPTIIVWVEILLYLSLICTLLSALLAVLGKQSLMYYGSAGDRGSIEQRGVQRQRKLDGLHKWRFDPSMQLFPLLLQFSLLIFATALSLYLWTIQHSIAGVLVGSTSLGISAYAFLIVSALSSPDSPFQTPLTTFISDRNRIRKLKGAVPVTTQGVLDWGRKLYDCIRPSGEHPQIVPENLSTSESGESENILDFYNNHSPEPSVALPAVLWVCETSTDSQLITNAVSMIVEMQWPLRINFDLTQTSLRLADAFMQCIEIDQLQLKIRDGAIQRAISCGQAYTILAILQKQDIIRQPYFLSNPEASLTPDADDKSVNTRKMRSMLQAFEGSAHCFCGITPSWLDWLFRVFPHIIHTISSCSKPEQLEIFLDNFDRHKILRVDISLFSNYLFFINSFFVPPDSRFAVLMNKSHIYLELLSQHFDVLSSSTIRIRQSLLELLDISKVYRFCSIIPRHSDGYCDAILSALSFARVEDRIHCFITDNKETLTFNVTWIYDALERIHLNPDAEWNVDTISAIGDLLQALYHLPLEKPTEAALRVILKSLASSSAELSELAFLILHRGVALGEKDKWGHGGDGGLRLTMQASSMWSVLGVVSLQKGVRFSGKYIEIGLVLSDITGWEAVLREELSTSVTGFFGSWNWSNAPEYSSLLRQIQNLDSGYTFKHHNERALGTTFMALSKAWDDFDHTDPRLSNFDRLICATTLAAFRDTYPGNCRLEDNGISLSSQFMDAFSRPLVLALCDAARRIRTEMTANADNSLGSLSETKSVLDAAAQILNKVGCEIPGRIGVGKGSEYWEMLYEEVQAKLKALQGKMYFITSGTDH
ncbi:hypothetical protein B0H17DRAFT_1335591 [Mycena rosella]|uniref:DUF6535 domain-containing protein n=1 Tax=Mycena rosella TaxID=1033263 RepID=A0AAD7CYJ8_MYCRO|nr:hypothetical protein B0H17DRAFT_1335591 [Mycena rosella]